MEHINFIPIKGFQDIDDWYQEFSELYTQAFSEPPYYETFTDEEVRNIMRELALNNKSILFLKGVNI